MFDIHTLDIETTNSTPNIDTLDESNTISDDIFHENDNANNFHSDYSDNSGDDYYEIDINSDNEDLPTYPITNMQMTVFDNDLLEFLHYHQDDQLNDWDYEELDSGPSCGPFYGTS